MKPLQWEHFGVVMEEQEIRPLSQVSLTGFSWGVIVVRSEYPFSLSLTFVSSYQILFLFQMTHGRTYLERRGLGRKGKKSFKNHFFNYLPPSCLFQQIFLSSAQWSSRRWGSIFTLVIGMCLTSASIHERISGPIPWLLQLHHLDIFLLRTFLARCFIQDKSLYEKMVADFSVICWTYIFHPTKNIIRS